MLYSFDPSELFSECPAGFPHSFPQIRAERTGRGRIMGAFLTVVQSIGRGQIGRKRTDTFYDIQRESGRSRGWSYRGISTPMNVAFVLPVQQIQAADQRLSRRGSDLRPNRVMTYRGTFMSRSN
jgi:hypothetical protein